MICVNQVGYEINRRKQAVVNVFGKYQILNQKCEVVLQKEPIAFGKDPLTQEELFIFDFSELCEEGTYQIISQEGEESCHFKIDHKLYQPVENAMLKSFYYQRCGCELEEEYAGVWKHAACHMKKVKILGDEQEVEIDAVGGWHDAGDYGRYVTAGAVAVSHLLWAYELYPKVFREKIHIPESENDIPDILNEVRYELEWMLKMQCQDGGVYHKLTSLRHANFVMPEDDQLPFYLFLVSSVATADFVAVMSHAARIYYDFDKEFASKLFHAAKRSWKWLIENPNMQFTPNPKGCNTGEYDDDFDKDERLWAAVELFYAGEILKDDYITPTTVLDTFMDFQTSVQKKTISQQYLQKKFTAMGWRDVAGLAVLRILQDATKKLGNDVYQKCSDAILEEAKWAVEVSQKNAFGIAMHEESFGWGSNMILGNVGIMLAAAYRLEPKEVYLEICQNHFDYILGKNITGYSFITGFGEKAFSNPHSRPCVADQVDEPIPGFVSGGPNSHPSDEKAEWLISKDTPPMKCYLDLWECYSLNEITIYWNSAVMLMSAFVLDCFEK